MGLRFRKTIKLLPGVKLNLSKSGVSFTLGKQGMSVTTGLKGTHANLGLPGTGLSYRQKLTSFGTGTLIDMITGKEKKGSKKQKVDDNLDVEYYVDEESAEIVFVDQNNKEIKDTKILRKIKASDEFKQNKKELEERRQEVLEAKVAALNAENNDLVNIGKFSPYVESKQELLYKLNNDEPLVMPYEVVPFDKKEPTEEDFLPAIQKEAEENVKGLFGVAKKREAYIKERLEEELSKAHSQWQEEKDAYDLEQAETKKELELAYEKDLERAKKAMENALKEDPDFIEFLIENWVQELSLPIDISVDYEYHKDTGTVCIDLDLPSEKDLSDTVHTLMASGKIVEKKKTQKQLKQEYVQLVFGVATFLASNIFDLSLYIQKITLSGYAQRRNEKADLENYYIFSLRLTREGFEKVEFDNVDPYEFCMKFENRVNLSSTNTFKEVEPYVE